ncbi:hypothetical protein GCM10009630_16050 [Kribbella jejuensis]|uniref:LppP/LprE lipoprotein n=1 Tax=Kribbella jejuensis TaxID=236068 RepID=A0A542EB52_9ACTN|nr:hypothetical protein [Kribbella jejuensis]TQJ12539.1 hypothetical protein FB475_5486 [Kribbella jejuensis]
MRWWAVTVSVLMLLVPGCSDTSGDNSSGTAPPAVTVTTEDTSEPVPEPTGAEPTQTRQDKPSIQIASLPIGGVPEDGANCNPISWLAGDIPNGVTIELGTPTFDPPGVFTLDQTGCPASSQSCEGLLWTSQDLPQCWVGFKQVGTEGTVTLVIPATATCETERQCAKLKSLGGSQITLTAQPPVTPPATETPTS